MITDKLGNSYYKVGLHIHTTLSDGHVSPERAAQIYRDAGFDAIAITDHWKFHAEDEIAGLKIISGCEYNVGTSDTIVNVMHIVGFGMEKEPENLSKQSARQDIIDGINKNGGIAVLAHPAWSLNSPEEVSKLSGFGGVEIYNTVSNTGQSNRPYSGLFVDLLANMGIYYPLVATDDTHYFNGTDETKSYIMVKAESCSQKDIVSAIKNGDFYATQGPELFVWRKDNKIYAQCSECEFLAFCSNTAWASDRVIRGQGITFAEYKIKPWEKWVRVEVCDNEGRYAWSNIIEIK